MTIQCPSEGDVLRLPDSGTIRVALSADTCQVGLPQGKVKGELMMLANESAWLLELSSTYLADPTRRTVPAHHRQLFVWNGADDLWYPAWHRPEPIEQEGRKTSKEQQS